jgi:hypothetical protein
MTLDLACCGSAILPSCGRAVVSSCRCPLVLVIGLFAVAGGLGAQQVDTVRVGSRALEGATLIAGSYTLASFERTDDRETRISATTQSVTHDRHGDLNVYRIHTTHVTESGDTTVASIVVSGVDFALVHHRVKASRDSTAVTAGMRHLTGWVVLPDEPIQLIDQRLTRPVFPVEGQIPWLFPLLPLAEGYAAAIPHYSQWERGEEWKTIRVIGSERLERNGRGRDCWKVDGGELFPGYRVTYWVDKDTRRVVEGVARGAEGEPEYWSRASWTP